MRVIVTGTLSFDYIMDFPGRFADRIIPDKIHAISLSFLVDKLSKQFGGTAGNIAYGLNLLGLTPVLLSVAGNDFDPYAGFLRDHGVETDKVRIKPKESTSSYFVITDQADNQIGSFYLGATKYAKELSIAEVAPSPVESDFVVISPTDPSAMCSYVAECRTLGLRYLYDPAFQTATFAPKELREGITGAAILIGNDYEISLIEQKLDISHEELRVTVPVVVTTLGGKGSVIETRKDSMHVKPAKARNVSDPTGAGDAYRAGFLAGYLRGFDLVTCGQMGSVAAVYTVEKYGTVTHAYTKKQFSERYMQNYGQSVAL